MTDKSVVNESLNNASEFGRSIPSRADGIAFCSALILSSVFIIAGNLLTLVLFAVNKALRKRSLFLVMNMTFADLMLGTITLPFYTYSVGGFLQLWTANYDSNHLAFKIFFRGFDTIFAFGSYLSVAFMSCERFHAIYWPFKHRTLSTRTYRISILILWTLAVSLSTILTLLSFFISFESSLYVFIPVLLTLTVITWVCNIGISRKLQHQSVTPQHQYRALRRKRLTNTLLFVSMLALLCWLPLVIIDILMFFTKTTIPWQFHLTVELLNYSNSFVNPVVYALRIPEFQQALRSCCRKRIPAIETKQTENRNRTAAPATPEIGLGILSVNPTHLQEDFDKNICRETHL